MSPHSSGQQDQTSDELVQLLSASSSLSQDEFLFELRRQRISQPEVTTA
ncbi:MAG: hypothetical protein JOZ36_09395 [Acidobacteria bacterium]|nr:hypothetical protein [Acidobacteriota bacterium]